MTEKPTTLDAALAWLNITELYAHIMFGDPIEVVAYGKVATATVHNGDIPAAIVSAVGDVWDQINTTKGEA